MKTQLLATAIKNGVTPLLYGEGAPTIYEVKFINQHLAGAIHLSSQNDVEVLMRALVEEWLRGQEPRLDKHSVAQALLSQNRGKSIPAIVRSIKVDDLITIYNDTHLQRISVTRL